MDSSAATVKAWYSQADTDSDGVLSGAEAVSFFQRSGLSQGTLAQIWESAAGDAATLNLPQFWTAVQLVSLAQREGGSFSQEQAASVMSGSQGRLPLPRMMGLEPSSAAAPQPQALQAPVQPQMASIPQSTAPSSAGGHWQWPPMTHDDYNRYAQAFKALDTDNDGWVTGGECFPAFLRSGLPRETLKAIWDLIAGTRGSLSAAEFLKAEYLIDCSLKGVPLPRTLPADPFPPTAAVPGSVPNAPPPVAAPGPAAAWQPVAPHIPATGSSASSYALDTHGSGYDTQALSRRRRSSIEIPQIPSLEELDLSSIPLPEPHIPPAIDEARLDCLSTDQKQRLEAEAKEGKERADKLYKLEVDSMDAARRTSHYRMQVSKMRIIKSRIDNVLLQASEKVRQHETEAQAITAQYNKAMSNLQEEHGESMVLMERGAAAVQRRIAAEQRLAILQPEIHAAAAAVPQHAVKDPVVEALEKQLARKEAEVAAAESRLQGYKEQMEMLSAKLAVVQGSQKAVPIIDAAKTKLAQLRQQAADPHTHASDKQAMLNSLCALHGTLAAAAEELNLPVPPLAKAPPSGQVSQVWVDTAQTGGAWASFDNKGVTVMDDGFSRSSEGTAGPASAGVITSASAATPASTNVTAASGFSSFGDEPPAFSAFNDNLVSQSHDGTSGAAMPAANSQAAVTNKPEATRQHDTESFAVFDAKESSQTHTAPGGFATVGDKQPDVFPAFDEKPEAEVVTTATATVDFSTFGDQPFAQASAAADGFASFDNQPSAFTAFNEQPEALSAPAAAAASVLSSFGEDPSVQPYSASDGFASFDNKPTTFSAFDQKPEAPFALSAAATFDDKPSAQPSSTADGFASFEKQPANFSAFDDKPEAPATSAAATGGAATIDTKPSAQYSATDGFASFNNQPTTFPAFESQPAAFSAVDDKPGATVAVPTADNSGFSKDKTKAAPSDGFASFDTDAAAFSSFNDPPAFGTQQPAAAASDGFGAFDEKTETFSNHVADATVDAFGNPVLQHKNSMDAFAPVGSEGFAAAPTQGSNDTSNWMRFSDDAAF